MKTRLFSVINASGRQGYFLAHDDAQAMVIALDFRFMRSLDLERAHVTLVDPMVENAPGMDQLLRAGVTGRVRRTWHGWKLVQEWTYP